MKRYIGNKEKILSKIDEVIKNNNIKGDIFLDLYSGTGSVVDYFKSKYEVIANDIMYYSYVVLKGKLSFNSKPLFKKFVDKYKKDPIDHLNAITAKRTKDSIIWKHFSPEGNRMYFTEENALKIDGARQEIDRLLKEKTISKNEWFYLLACIISTANSKGNTTGTFGAYLKNFSPSTIKEIEFTEMQCRVGNIGKVYMGDGKEIISKTSSDILYLDPPYTAIDYSQAYHFLESLALYDSHEYKGITGRRIDNEKTSAYTKEKTALKELEQTIEIAENHKNIILSYSSHGIMKKDEILNIFKKYYNEVKIESFEYQKYRNVYSNDKGNLEEYLFVAKGRK